jgi:predicted aspartyl protease
MKYLLLLILLCLPIPAAAVAQIVVPVTITYQGRSVTAPMAVDTGASVTTIDDSLADQLGITACSGSGQAQMADGSAVPYCSAVMDSLAASSMTRAALRINIMDYSANRQARGMLGLDFLSGMTLTLDWKNRRIYWSE